MWKIIAVLLIGATGQAPSNPERIARSIAPFVDPDALVVMEADLDRADIGAMAARLAGDDPSSLTNEWLAGLAEWSRRLRGAGVREIGAVISLDDLPGPPVLAVPAPKSGDPDRIGRLLCGKEGGAVPFACPSYAVIRGAVVAGTERAIDRIRRLEPSPQPDLSEALAAAGGDAAGVRMALLPSAETRRVLEELVPDVPRELGGGPITDWTRGVRWISAGMAGPEAPLRIVVAAADADAARKLAGRGPALARFLAKAPVDRDIPRLVGRLATAIDGDRIRMDADPEVAAGLLDAAIRPVVESMARTRCIANQKQIALAIHNHLAATGRKRLFPPAYSTDGAGKPLLSWRVLILPYLDQKGLYDEFHRDEPWDSPHNRALIGKMPAVYRCPLESAADARDGKTRYVAPRSPGTILRGADPVGIMQVNDGTSNTILFLDAGDATSVPWTKPNDWEIAGAGIEEAFRAHRGPHGPGTCAAFADGSVRFLKASVPTETLRAFCTYAGGEVLAPE